MATKKKPAKAPSKPKPKAKAPAKKAAKPAKPAVAGKSKAAKPAASKAAAKPAAPVATKASAQKAAASSSKAEVSKAKTSGPAKKSDDQFAKPLAPTGKTKSKPAYLEVLESKEFDDELGVEEAEELDENAPEEEESVEGPPPWWKDDPTGIEASEDEQESRANFDDSDEWTEDDEEWGSGSARGAGRSIESVEEESSDEDDRW